ncbi:MAG: NADH-quinone oxidoreductase subunit M [Verrucomicrobia bacterium]|nr:NADH-quinone oxidoreductase subunit M [Verrucomicrobiota bacterium]
MAGLISALILVPIIGALLLALTPERFARGVAFASTLASAIIALCLWHNFDSAAAGLQFVERHTWIPAISAEYLVGVDGLSLLLVLLTTLLFPFAFSAERSGRGFYALMLLMQSALYGTFTAQNFVLWFLFYEMSLVPSFLLIKIFGGHKRDRAATKFFVYTFLASVAMLLAFLGIYLLRGTFDFAELARLGRTEVLPGNLRWLVFAGIFFGLAVKVPLYPFHTWLPDAYETAPTGVAMVLTGALSKMGVYGFIRLLLPLFPNEIRVVAPWLLALAVCSIVLGSLAAWAQSDLKRMVAYLSVNHLGYCMLGLFALGGAAMPSIINVQTAFSGVFLQMFNHGITAAALFYFVGILEQRRGLRGIHDFGGLMQCAPVFCGWMSVAIFSSLGLPGLNGFIGEFLIFKSSFGIAAVFTSVAVLGLLFTAITFLRAMQLLFSGPATDACHSFPDLFAREKAIVIPVALLMLVIGVAPQFMFNIFNTAVVQMARLFA